MSLIHGNDNQSLGLNVAELSGDDFGTPDSGRWGLYFKNDGAYIIDDIGTVSKVALDGTESFDIVSVSDHYTFSDGRLTSLDGAKPGVYMSANNSGSYPFNGDDHLIIQAASDAASKDIVFITGDTPTMRGIMSSGGLFEWRGFIRVDSGGVIAPNANADNLYIDVTGGAAGLSILTDNNQSGYILFGDSGDDDVGGLRYNHSDNTLYMRAGAVELARLSSTGLTITHGGTPIITVTETDNTVSAFLSSDGTTGIVGTSTNHSLLVKTNSTTAITIDASQNVGIGVSPTARLHVGGTLTSTSGAAGVFLANPIFNPASPPAAFTVWRGLALLPSTAPSAVDMSNASLFGAVLAPTHNGTSTLGALTGFYAQVINGSTGTVTAARGIHIAPASKGSGTIGTAVGLYLEAQTQGTFNFSIYAEGGVMHVGDDLEMDSIFTLLADQTSDTVPSADTTRKKITLQYLASPPSNAAYIQWQNSPGGSDFYWVLEEG